MTKAELETQMKQLEEVINEKDFRIAELKTMVTAEQDFSDACTATVENLKSVIRDIIR